MQLKHTISLLVLLLIWNCTEQQKEEQKTTQQEIVEEDDLFSRLSVDLIAKPHNQEEQERNTIINYALDSLWNIKKTSSGLYYHIVKEGEGKKIAWADRLEVHYRGFFSNGKQFDSSYDRGKSLQFYVGNMINGWNEGLQLVAPKSELCLLVPSRLAYGEKGLVNSKGDTLVPADQVLIFKIEVLRKI